MNITDWYGHEQMKFEVGGRKSFIVCPEHPLPGNPWVWRTEFFGAFDIVDRALLDQGWHLAYHSASSMYGNPESIRNFDEFYQVAVQEYHMNEKVVLFGFSRGGLYAFNFALKYPDRVKVIYLDAPVLDLKSWPGGLGHGVGDVKCYHEAVTQLGYTEENFAEYHENPLDNTEKLAAHNIPIIIVYGDSDEVVPYDENALPFFHRYRAAGGDIEMIGKRNCNHHPHSLDVPEPVVWFINDRYFRQA